MIDAAVIKDGELIGIEVITRNYKKEEVEGKMNMAKMIGCKDVIKFEV